MAWLRYRPPTFTLRVHRWYVRAHRQRFQGWNQPVADVQMHHLAGVGHLLGSVIQSPLSQWTYLQVRNVLLAMVDLLASLEACSSTEGGSQRLKAHIQRIDAYMTNAARERQGQKVYHSALPKEAWSNEQSLRTTVSSIVLLKQSCSARKSAKWR